MCHFELHFKKMITCVSHTMGTSNIGGAVFLMKLKGNQPVLNLLKLSEFCISAYELSCFQKHMKLWPYFRVKTLWPPTWHVIIMVISHVKLSCTIPDYCYDIFYLILSYLIIPVISGTYADSSAFINPGMQSYEFQKRDSAFATTGHSLPHYWECMIRKFTICPFVLWSVT